MQLGSIFELVSFLPFILNFLDLVLLIAESKLVRYRILDAAHPRAIRIVSLKQHITTTVIQLMCFVLTYHTLCIAHHHVVVGTVTTDTEITEVV